MIDTRLAVLIFVVALGACSFGTDSGPLDETAGASSASSTPTTTAVLSAPATPTPTTTITLAPTSDSNTLNPNHSASNPNTPAAVTPTSNPNWALVNIGLPAWQPDQMDPNHTSISIVVDASTQVVRLTTTLLVPPKPPASGTDFIWPGLEAYTGSPNPNNVSGGVLQPVLTWGPSCAPNQLPQDTYAFWWVSGQYVDASCHGGPTMRVAPGDGLLMDMVLVGSVWTQTVTDLATQQSVSYVFDEEGLWQNWVLFFLEDYGDVPPPADMVFVNTTITLADAVANPVDLTSEGNNCFVSQMTASSDGKSISIPRIILRAPGIPQTYQN